MTSNAVLATEYKHRKQNDKCFPFFFTKKKKGRQALGSGFIYMCVFTYIRKHHTFSQHQLSFTLPHAISNIRRKKKNVMQKIKKNSHVCVCVQPLSSSLHSPSPPHCRRGTSLQLKPIKFDQRKKKDARNQKQGAKTVSFILFSFACVYLFITPGDGTTLLVLLLLIAVGLMAFSFFPLLTHSDPLHMRRQPSVVHWLTFCFCRTLLFVST